MGTLELFLPIVLVPLMPFISRLSTKHLPAFFFPKSPSTFKVKRSVNSQNGISSKVATGDDAGEETVTMKLFLETRVCTKDMHPNGGSPQDTSKPDGSSTETLQRSIKYCMNERYCVCQTAGRYTPVVVTLHGLIGDSHESYVRSILASACSPKSSGGLGYRGAVINNRGYAGVPLTSPQFYSAGHTNDLGCAPLYLSGRYLNAPLLGIGISMGANFLIRAPGVHSLTDSA